MTLFEISKGEIVPFQRVKIGPDLYEKEIERLVWENFEDFVGEALFPIRRQAKLPKGGIADIVALDKSGRVVVFEVKRDVDRKQIAQCLEYAGWARQARLQEVAQMYSGGADSFFQDWPEFTESTAPLVVDPHPRLFLIARDFEARTESAFNFLVESGVPVHMVRVSMYEDKKGRRFVDVEGFSHEPDLELTASKTDKGDHTTIAGRPIRVEDLIDAGLVHVGDALVWTRPRLKQRYEAEIADETGNIRLSDGRTFASPSKAAVEAAKVPACDGWYVWKVTRVGKLLNALRIDLVSAGPKG